MANPTIAELIRQVKQGEEACERLCIVFEAQVLGFMRSKLGGVQAEDATQEVLMSFVAALRAGSIDPGKARSWIFSTAYNVRADMLSRLARDSCHPLPDDVAEPTSRSLTAGTTRVPQAVIDALDRLPATWSRVIRLREEGLAYKEIAERVGTSVGSVRNCLHRARERLRDLLEGSL